MINNEKKILGRHIERRYSTKEKIYVDKSDVEEKIQNCVKLYNETMEPFFDNVKKILIIIAYKQGNILKLYDIPKDWKVFVISKEYFIKLYGPTLNKLAQYYQMDMMRNESE